jgi:hypothetical protein
MSREGRNAQQPAERSRADSSDAALAYIFDVPGYDACVSIPFEVVADVPHERHHHGRTNPLLKAIKGTSGNSLVRGGPTV